MSDTHVRIFILQQVFLLYVLENGARVPVKACVQPVIVNLHWPSIYVCYLIRLVRRPSNNDGQLRAFLHDVIRWF